MKTFRYLIAAMTLGATAISYAWDPTVPTTINRSMNVVQVTNTTGGPVNDFHIEFIARDLAGNYLDLEDLDPLGYYNNVGGVALTTTNSVTHRITIAWAFGPLAPGASATFGFTLFGGFRFDGVDCYWTLNGTRVQSFPDVWQDWVTVDPPTREIQDIIVYRPSGVPLPPLVPTTLLRTVSATPFLGLMPIDQVAILPAPPDPLPILPPDAVVPATPISYPWAWPYDNATYFMFYTAQNMMGQPIMNFRNAAQMARNPIRYSTVPYELSSDAFPPTDTGYGSTTEVSFSGDVMIRNLKVEAFSSSTPLPSDAGGAVIQSFTSQASLEISTDAGMTWQTVVAPPAGLARAALETNNDGIRTFDTEMLQLTFSGSGLPEDLRIRESPTLPSRGRISATEVGERYQIDSFFDVFLEVSTDGGQNWQPGSTAVELNLAPPPTVTLNRSLNMMRVWTGPGVWANDFHVEFEARNGTDTRYLDLDDLDPTGFYQGLFVTNRVVSYNALSNRVSITWYFPDVCITTNAPAFFGFTLFGGVRYQAVDWYWTYNGERIIAFQDVWQDWLKNPLTSRLEDVIMPRPIPIPPPPIAPTPVVYLQRVTGSTPAPISIATLAAMAIPPNPVLPEPGPVLVTNLVPVVYDWAWPGVDPTYFMYYDLLDEAGQPIAGFRNAASLVEAPDFDTELPQFAATSLFPPPTLHYVEKTEAAYVTYGLVWTRDFTIRALSPDLPLPAPGEATLGTFPARIQFDLSGDGGSTWQTVFAEIQVTARIVSTGRTAYFDMELIAVEAPPLPGGLRIRESSTLPSLGCTHVEPGEGGGYWISSFFDIFTELSIDGGGSWTPGSRKTRVILQNLANETAPSEKRFLPKDTACDGSSPFFAHFPNGVQLHDFTLGFVSHAGELPEPGQTSRVTFMARAAFNLSNTSGGWDYTWSTVRAEADLTLLGSESGTDVYSADFKRFDLFGGTMPTGLMVRVRSQSRAESSGVYAVREDGGGGYRVDSFFDIFLEVSTDSGGSWTGAERPSGLLLNDAKPAPVVLEAWADPRSKQALVMFNRPLGPSAVDPNNYTLAGDNPATMRLLRDGRTVLAGFTNTPPTPAILTVQDVYDEGGQVVSPTTATVCEGLIQRHAVAAASLYVGQPDNPARDISLLGSSLLLMEVPYSGLAHDSDGDGFDDAIARILDLDLEDTEGSYALRSSDQSLSLGTVEEQANPVSHHLDLPPFGVGQGLFQIGQFNFIVEIDGVSHTPQMGLTLEGEFLDAYMSGGASLGWSVEPPLVPLLDEDGEESGYTLGRLTLMPDLPSVSLEIDGDGTWHVRWPKPSTNMRLQVATSLELQDWATIDPGAYLDEGDQWSYEITPEGESRFYRLRLVEPELFPQ